MRIEIAVRNRDEKDKVMKILDWIKNSPDYKDLDEYAWRYAFVNDTKVIIDKEILPTELESFEIECECGQKTQSECELSCVRFEVSNENGEQWENG